MIDLFDHYLIFKDKRNNCFIKKIKGLINNNIRCWCSFTVYSAPVYLSSIHPSHLRMFDLLYISDSPPTPIHRGIRKHNASYIFIFHTYSFSDVYQGLIVQGSSYIPLLSFSFWIPRHWQLYWLVTAVYGFGGIMQQLILTN